MSLISLWNGLCVPHLPLERFVIGHKKGVENVLVSSSVQALALPTTIDKTIAPTPRYAYSTALTADVYATDVGAIANHLHRSSQTCEI